MRRKKQPGGAGRGNRHSVAAAAKGGFMELTFIGADHEVTGSCHFLRAAGKNILIDCGMEQGHDDFVNQPLPVNPSNIDYVLITHAHIDHTGMLPKLYHDGYRGPVISTEATKDLCDIMLRDSAHIQAQEAEYAKRKAAKRGDFSAVQPVYTMEDAMNAVRLFKAYPYDQIVPLCEGIRFRFTDIGHLLGSASIELWLTENGEERKIVFSGDIGNKNQPLLRDPKMTDEADYVVMESTYGDRLHEKAKGDHVLELADAIRKTLLRGGNLVIPAFAVGRTQVILYFIRQIKMNNMIPELPDFPVYVDSPMAVEATSVFEECRGSCFDEDAMKMVNAGVNPITFPNLHLTITQEESIAINNDDEPKVIISASGMCDAGRIKHHLKYNISRPDSAILFVGYQAEGSLGRRLTDGAPEVKIFGETFSVRAEILVMDGLSGHADKNGLLEWIGAFRTKPKQVFVVHGDDAVAESFAQCLQEEHGMHAMAPYSGTKYDLLKGEFIRIAKPVPVPHGEGNVRAASSSFTKLTIAKKRLDEVIEAGRGLPNKELDQFTKEINDLCRKYGIPVK